MQVARLGQPLVEWLPAPREARHLKMTLDDLSRSLRPGLIGAVVGLGIGLVVAETTSRFGSVGTLALAAAGFAGGRRAWNARSIRGWVVVTLSVAVFAMWIGVFIGVVGLLLTPQPDNTIDLTILPLLIVGAVFVGGTVGIAIATVFFGPSVLGAAIAWSVAMWTVRRLVGALGGAPSRER